LHPLGIPVEVGFVRLAVAEAQYSRLPALSSPTHAANVHPHATWGVPAAMQAMYASWQASWRASRAGAAEPAAIRARVRATTLENMSIGWLDKVMIVFVKVLKDEVGSCNVFLG
jgi:hypothetical protein